MGHPGDARPLSSRELVTMKSLLKAMTAHEGPRTTKLYDRTKDQITLDEVEKIGIWNSN
jgi:hypothetical protein